MAGKRKTTKPPERPFDTKGKAMVAPKGESIYCKIVEPEYHAKFSPKGEYSVRVRVNPEDPVVIKYVADLEAMLADAEEQLRDKFGDDVENMIVNDVFEEEYIDDEPTGMILFTFKMKNVDDREEGNDFIKVIDEYKRPIKHEEMPLVGNGSIIRCRKFTYPYYMPFSSKKVKGKEVFTEAELGITGIWDKMQLIKLEEYAGGDDDFDDESGESDDGFDNESSKPKAKKSLKKKPKKSEDDDDGDY